MGTLKTWRKAYGALKDSTKVGLAHVNSDYAELDVAIVKATNHVECPPKERHLRKIAFATSAVRPRADVAYCIQALSRRLTKTHNWTVALKTLIVIHRLLREGDPTFREELLAFSQRGRILQLSNFKDDSSPIEKYLKPKKIREAEEAAWRSRITKTVIRVRFPENHTLEATFHP